MSPYIEVQTALANGTGTIIGASEGEYTLMAIHYRVDNSTGVDFSTAGITSTPVTVTDGEEFTQALSF